MLETENISPFGEIRSALDLLAQHVFRVDSVVPGTELVAAMQSTVRTVVRTQVWLR